MTLDEAIKDCLETVSQNEEEAEAYSSLAESHTDTFEKQTAIAFSAELKKFAEKYKQFAAWLTELKNLREIYEIQKKSIEKCDKCSDITHCPLFYPWL